MADTCEIFDKRAYNTYPFIVLQKDIYNCNLGGELKILVHLYERTNLFGDKTPFLLSGYSIIFKLYDVYGNLITNSTANINNMENSEILTTIDPLFIKKSGTYYGYFTFANNQESFTLPTPNDRTRIKIQYK